MYSQQSVRRYPVRRRGPNWVTILLGCGAVLAVCAVVTVVGVVLLLPRVPGLAAQVAGLTPRGSTDEVFAAAPPAPPTIALQEVYQPNQVTVNLGSYGGPQVIEGESQFYDVSVGADDGGQQTAVVTFTEAGLMDLCRQRSDVCAGSNPQYQNIRLDLRPGGAVVYADVNIPTQYGVTVQQTLGVVLRLDSSGRQFEFAGIDLNGELYGAPPNEYASLVADFERTGNEILSQVSVDAGGGTLALQYVTIDDSTLTAVMQ